MKEDKKLQAGDHARLTAKFLRSTGQYKGREANGRWQILAISGDFAVVNEPADLSYYTAEELRRDPSLRWRHIALGNLERVGADGAGARRR